MKTFTRFKWLIPGGIILVMGSLLILGILIMTPGTASVRAQTDLPSPTPVVMISIPMGDADCLECHQLPDMYLPLPGGEELYLTVDREEYQASIHGQAGYACVQCHSDITGYPHPKLEANDLRSVSLQMAEICQGCHIQASEEHSQGLHKVGLTNGNLESAICTDCHGAHDIQPFGEDHLEIAETCQDCHTQIYDVYKDSVHGAALLEQQNQDVPTCVDCHNAHSNIGPDKDGFHLYSPQICATCHADQELMAEYDINTDVFDTYIADFHGTTVTLFEQISPDQETNKPVCIDCHGVHDILPPDNTESWVYEQNLLDTCQRCHPDATVNFPAAWLSHYPPDKLHNPLVYLVDLFYQFFIPITLGGMTVFVVSDAWRRKTKRSTDEEILKAEPTQRHEEENDS